MESSTSAGSNEPRKASTRASTRSATETAFAPLRFETARVTAGHRAGSPAEADLTYCDGSSPPSWTRATSPKHTGRPPATPTTTRRTSSAQVRNDPASNLNSWFELEKLPAGRRRLAAPTAPATSEDDR